MPPLRALAGGSEVPLQVVGTPQPTDTTATIRLGLSAMPPFSWSAVDLVPGTATPPAAVVSLSLEDANGAPATGTAVARVVLSNGSVTATWSDGGSGFVLTSLLLGGKETIAAGSVVLNDYADQGGLWRLGNEMNGCSLTPMAPPPPAETVEVIEADGVFADVVFHGADADREASLAAGAIGLDLAVTTGAAMATTRTVSFSLAVPAGAVLTTSEPAGSAARVAERIYTPTFWPAVGWAEVGDTAILLRQSTGVRMSTPGAVELMAARDARQEQCDVEGGDGSDTGTHRIEWRIQPASTAAEAEQVSQAFNRPIDLEVVPLAQAATLDLPAATSLLGVSGDGIVSALKPADRGGGVILRAVLMPGPVTVTLPASLAGKQMTRVDVAERDGTSLGTAGTSLVLDPKTFGAIASVRLQ